MDMEGIRWSISMRASRKTAYLVDMAKAEVLRSMGDYDAARELIGQYLK